MKKPGVILAWYAMWLDHWDRVSARRGIRDIVRTPIYVARYTSLGSSVFDMPRDVLAACAAEVEEIIRREQKKAGGSKP